MDARTFAARANVRVVSSLRSAIAEEEMVLAGVHSQGIRIMAARAEFLVVRMEAVPFELARRLKEAMHAVGGDAAIEETAWAGAHKETPAVIMGTRRQFKDALRSLEKEGPEGEVLAEVLAETFDHYNRRDFVLHTRAGELRLGQGPPAIMGILNVTPDSFSDGGSFLQPAAAVDHARRMADEGAGVIDVGGESTRPGSPPVDADEELRRIMPVITAIVREVRCPISVDTSKAAVARQALGAGAAIVNDVTALSGDPDMAGVVAESGCPVVLMHMKGTPLTMQKSPFYADLMGEITAFLRRAIDAAVSAGVDREQIIVDPGIGFGKTVNHNLRILLRLKELSSLGRPILVGPSRKSFVGRMLSLPVGERIFGTAAAVAMAAASGAAMLRVHDVKEMRQVAAVAACISAGGAFEENT